MKKANKKTILIAVILAILLIGVGIVVLLNLKQGNKNEPDVKDSRCVDKICISKVYTEENDDQKAVIVVLKNEGNKAIKNSCVNLISNEKKYTICLNDAQANEELEMSFEYSDTTGNTIEDFSLEKASEEEAKEANKKREEILNNIK